MQDKGYPQNIQMVPQGANYQAPPNSNQEGDFDQSGPYLNAPPTVIQQGIIYQAVPANPQVAMYPNAGYPNHPQAAQYANYPVSNQMLATSDQIHLMNPYNQVFMIETKIKSEFCCYTCLVYTGLIFSILSLLGALSDPANHPFMRTLNVFLTIAVVVGYVLAIQAKSTFNTKKQHQAYIIFCILAAIRFLVSILFIKSSTKIMEEEMAHDSQRHQNGYDQMNPRQIRETAEGAMMFGILVVLLLDLLLIYYAHAVRKLMKERDQILMNLNAANTGSMA